MMDTEEKKEFARLKRRTMRLIDKEIEFTDLEVAAISKVGNAKSMLDISWLVEQQMERIFDKYKVR